ncbi:MAG TPA: hypothetical protein VI074_02705, partial [Propionibacteriaceae bacterium]
MIWQPRSTTYALYGGAACGRSASVLAAISASGKGASTASSSIKPEREWQSGSSETSDHRHTSRPWRIHQLTPDFHIEDVWALATPGGPNELPRLVSLI